MIKFEHTDVYGFEPAIRGMRNPFKNTDKSDSGCGMDRTPEPNHPEEEFTIGPKDAALCHRLNKGGSPHNKFLRQIVCWVDITAPLTWWKQFDTYRFGVEKNAESTMHTIMKYPFTENDFSGDVWEDTLSHLNYFRKRYLEVDDLEIKRDYWQTLIDNLPQSYLQKRTCMMSYQAIRAICEQRKGHKLGEWHEFIKWAKALPESWLLFDELYIEPEDPYDNDSWETKAAIAAGR